MIRTDIISFVKTGELEGFPMGTPLLDITSQLGENPGWTVSMSRKDKRPALIKYGQVEFYFTPCVIQKLHGLQIIYTQAADKKELNINYDELEEVLSYEQTKVFLAKHDIGFKEGISDIDKETRILQTESHVIFYFSEDNELEKFSRFSKV